MGGENSNKKISLWVIAEKMEICSYLHVGKTITYRVFLTGWTVSSVYTVADIRYC
jgi:hypothetical protein